MMSTGISEFKNNSTFFSGWEKFDFMNSRLTPNVSSMDNFGLDPDLQLGHFGRLDQPI